LVDSAGGRVQVQDGRGKFKVGRRPLLIANGRKVAGCDTVTGTGFIM
jgi:hypothetical protein